MSIFSCYSPTDTKVYSGTTKDPFYNTLSKAIKNVMLEHPSFKFILGGDFNVTVGRDCEPDKLAFVGNNHGTGRTSKNGLGYLNFVKNK